MLFPTPTAHTRISLAYCNAADRRTLSQLALQRAACEASGRPFLWRPTTAKRVFYVSAQENRPALWDAFYQCLDALNLSQHERNEAGYRFKPYAFSDLEVVPGTDPTKQLWFFDA